MVDAGVVDAVLATIPVIVAVVMMTLDGTAGKPEAKGEGIAETESRVDSAHQAAGAATTIVVTMFAATDAAPREAAAPQVATTHRTAAATAPTADVVTAIAASAAAAVVIAWRHALPDAGGAAASTTAKADQDTARHPTADAVEVVCIAASREPNAASNPNAVVTKEDDITPLLLPCWSAHQQYQSPVSPLTFRAGNCGLRP